MNKYRKYRGEKIPTRLDETVSEEWIKEKLLSHYGAGVDRKLHRSIHKDNHGIIGSIHYSLEGSPPKGYAIYTLKTGYSSIWMYDHTGKRFKIYERVKIEEIEEMAGR